ncbi:efflux transporter outer membrane subunit [Altericroceibacterium endophyticum]|uniref:Efflux transporter outer membrane subunit n=1 Tax=Altericroceibacterium endophyticum TaxID=1808508 RepID=A0A6I4T7I4_9SPHN|nr:efflux transporter outer membrane subunit [Altericroceibacterium endophyticum]MXO65745.1 efflux transporter outer membrane subunit [Altericroceibacterium endophyticum]
MFPNRALTISAGGRYHHLRRILGAGAGALALSACATGPDYRPPSASELGLPDSYSVAETEDRADMLTRWWTLFDDPQLIDLVEESRAANLDVAQALARLKQARAALSQSRASLFPTIATSGGYGRNVGIRGATLPDTDSFNLGVDASWQADIFGGNRRDVEASLADLTGQGLRYADVLAAVEAEMARNYVILRGQQAQLANARASFEIQQDNYEIATFRVQAGLVSSLDSEQARIQRSQTAANIIDLEAAIAQTTARLAVLAGREPGAFRERFSDAQDIPSGDAGIGIGVPADVLRMRPDVMAAERSLAAATARIGVARAALLPALNIGGTIDTSADNLDGLFDLVSGQIFVKLAQTVFDGGARRAAVTAREAAAEEALAAYRQSVNTALEDVENALVSARSAESQLVWYEDALQAAENFAILSRSQYRAGLTDFVTLNNAESALLSARNSVDQARTARSTALIQLYLALGGGWEVADIPDGSAVEPIGGAE